MTKTKPEEKQALTSGMEEAIYRLSLLCASFEKNKDAILKESANIRNAVETLQAEIAALSKTKSVAGNLSPDAIENIQSTLKISLDDPIRRLTEVAELTEKKLLFFYNLDKKRIWQMAIGLVVLPIIVAVIVAKLLIPHPISFNVDGVSCEDYVRASHSQ